MLVFEVTNVGDLLLDHPVDTELIVADACSRYMTVSRETVIRRPIARRRIASAKLYLLFSSS